MRALLDNLYELARLAFGRMSRRNAGVGQLLDKLCELALRRVGSPQQLRTDRDVQDRLDPGLTIVIRRALRSGGNTLMARWVANKLGFEPGSPRALDVDPKALASQLCKEIVCHLQSQPSLWKKSLVTPALEGHLTRRGLDWNDPCWRTVL